MMDYKHEAILLVCGCEQESAKISSRLFDAGFSVVGPVPNASLALAMAAQTFPTIALVATPPTGRRGATELADELMRTWGIRSWVRKGAARHLGAKVARSWKVAGDRIAHIRAALRQDAGERGIA